MVPRLKKIWADGAYSGKELAKWCKEQRGWELDIVERDKETKGFEVVAKRWRAHVADLIPEAYDVMSKPGGIIKVTMGSESNSMEVPIAGVHFVMARQMAYEVLSSPAVLELSSAKKC